MENKYLTIALVAAICVSLGGTFLTLNKLSEVQQLRITGYATSAQGTGEIEILQTQSIIINATNNTIDFGICTADTVNVDPYNLTSNSAAPTASWGNCTTQVPAFPAFIEVINDGNQDINLTVQSSLVASQFIGGTAGVGGPQFGFITFNETGATGDGGCNTRKDGGPTTTESVIGTWAQFNGNHQQACYNFTYNTQFRTTLRLYLYAQIPTNPLPGTRTATITFTANPFLT